MFSFFRRKTLEEKRQIVKQAVSERKITFNDAHLMYAACAFKEYEWNDVAASFIEDSIRERVRILTER